MSEPTSSNSKSSASDAACKRSVTFCGLPVLLTPWTPAHWLELSPSLVTSNVWSSSPLSPSCSVSWVSSNAKLGTLAANIIIAARTNAPVRFILTRLTTTLLLLLLGRPLRDRQLPTTVAVRWSDCLSERSSTGPWALRLPASRGISLSRSAAAILTVFNNYEQSTTPVSRGRDRLRLIHRAAEKGFLGNLASGIRGSRKSSRPQGPAGAWWSSAPPSPCRLEDSLGDIGG